jgi:hypothetical protein
MSNVSDFTGKTRLPTPVNQILARAAGKGATDIVVIGWDRDGKLFLMSSDANGAEVNYLIDQGKLSLLEMGRE